MRIFGFPYVALVGLGQALGGVEELSAAIGAEIVGELVGICAG